MARPRAAVRGPRDLREPLGVTLSRSVLRLGPLATLPAAELRTRLAATIGGILRDPA